MTGIDRPSADLRVRRVGSFLARRPTRQLGRRAWRVEALEDRTLLSTFTVNSLGDAGVGTGLSGDLRYVITKADQTTGDNTIEFAVTGTIALNSDLPDLSNTTGLTDIAGPGASSLTVTRNGFVPSIFTVDADVRAEIASLTVNGGGIYKSGGGISNSGKLTVTGSAVENNDSGLFGGIENLGGTLTVADSTITDNQSGGEGGGGIENASGTVTVMDSTIDNNSSAADHGFFVGTGGGISNDGSMTITDSTIDNNRARQGGGIENHGTLTVINSTIADNTSRGSFDSIGGGIENDGTLTLTNSTIADNSELGNIGFGGYGPGNGGGIANGGTLTIANSTIAGNNVSYGGIGGGLYVYSGTLTITNSTIADNNVSGGSRFTTPSGGTSVFSDGIAGGLYVEGLYVGSGAVTLDNTIVALNTDTSTSGVTADDIDGTVASSSAYNLIGTGGSGGLTDGTNGNQVGVVNPGLGPLANNGGPTQTIALLPGSPAIDKGSNALAIDPTTGLPLTTDQRGPGFVRIINGTVNIGAYEFTPDSDDALSVTWGTQTAALQTAADGLRLLPAGRNTDSPWLGIDQLPITLSRAYSLTAADVFITSAIGVNYGPVTVSGSGTSYTIALARSIDAADRVTLIVNDPGISAFYRRLDVLPGDFNDDGVVNSQDLAGIRNEWLGIGGARPTIFGDINGDGKVNVADYNAERLLIGTSLPSVSDTSIALSPASQGGPAVVRMGTSSPSPRTSVPRARPRAEIQLSGRGSIRGTLLTRGRPINQPLIEPPAYKAAIG